MSSTNSVGAMDGGTSTTPRNGLTPRARPIAVTARMPMSGPPVTRRASSAAMRTRPVTASTAGHAVTSPSATSVASLPSTRPALRIAMIARKKPMPADVASLSERGKALITHSRTGSTDSAMKQTPETKTAPSAVCHGWPMPSTTP